MTVYRVHYTQGTNVVGCFDMAQDHVEETHRGSVETAILDSGFDLTFRHVTGWERLEA